MKKLLLLFLGVEFSCLAQDLTRPTISSTGSSTNSGGGGASSNIVSGTGITVTPSGGNASVNLNSTNSGTFVLGNNIPTDIGVYTRQLGVSGNGYIYWYNGTGWTNTQFNFGTGFASSGQKIYMPSNSWSTDITLAGNTTDQVASSVNQDIEYRLHGMSPWSRTGYSVNFMTTNAVLAASLGFNTNFPTITNINGVVEYEADVHVGSLIIEHDQGASNNITGVLEVLSDSTNFPVALVVNGGGNPTGSGNQAYVMTDPINHIVGIPLITAVGKKPGEVGFTWAFQQSLDTGTFIFGGSGSGVFTNNVSLRGTLNQAPNQLASVAGAIMTRSLSDTRYGQLSAASTWANQQTYTIGIAIGASTNTLSFTLVNTNWIDGATYTNQTGRPILVITPCKVIPGTGIGGNATYALQVPGTTTNVLSIGTLAASLAMPQTNEVSAFITNSGTFTFTNVSSGTGSSAAIVVGGQYMVY